MPPKIHLAGALSELPADLREDLDTELERDIDGATFFSALFQEVALRTTPDFDRAYEEARRFGSVLAKRGQGSGFMLTLMQQRVCSSVIAGPNTAQTLARQAC